VRTAGLARLLQVTSVRSLAPAYLTAADTPWLRALLNERERFVGHRRRDWRARLTAPLPVAAPVSKLRTAISVLDRLSKDQVVMPVAPRRLRATLFREAANCPDRRGALDRAATTFGLSPEQVLETLFGDLPDERRLAPLSETIEPAQLALLCNEAIVDELLAKALRVRVTARGNVRAVVRHAKLMGLLCHALPGEGKDDVTLQLSGPYALFRHTRLYGRALASLVPRLAWCHSYRLEADCVMGDDDLGRLVVQSGDPITPARELSRFDSQVEERFARGFEKLACDWDVIREPLAIAVGDALMFPDFELVHRGTGERWLLEIVGYWTPEYLTSKLARLRAARIERLILCIDEARCCGDGELEAIGTVLRYRRRVDPRAVLAIVDPLQFSRLPVNTR
jgi:uncharacterized protein